MRLYFVRHGESEANVSHVISNRGWKHGLTETGCEQARALAARLRGHSIARIYTSPLMRAVQTAEILAGALGVPCERTDALREFDCGEAEDRADDGAWAMNDWIIREWIEGRFGSRIPGGESLEEIQARFFPLVDGLIQKGEDALLVGHGGTYLCTLPALLANVAWSFALQKGIPNTGYVLAEPRTEGLVCLEWCGVTI